MMNSRAIAPPKTLAVGTNRFFPVSNDTDFLSQTACVLLVLGSRKTIGNCSTTWHGAGRTE